MSEESDQDSLENTMEEVMKEFAEKKGIELRADQKELLMHATLMVIQMWGFSDVDKYKRWKDELLEEEIKDDVVLNVSLPPSFRRRKQQAE